MKIIVSLILLSIVASASPIYLKCEITDKTPDANQAPTVILLDVKLNEETSDVTVTDNRFDDAYNMKGFFSSTAIKAQHISASNLKIKTVYEIDRKTLGMSKTSTVSTSYKRFEGTCKIIEVSKNKI